MAAVSDPMVVRVGVAYPEKAIVVEIRMTTTMMASKKTY